MLGWRPVYGHPAGPSDMAWFVLHDDGDVFPTRHHPEATRGTVPWFVVVDPLVFRAHGHPEGPSTEPDYQIIGSFLYLTEPVSDEERGPWYQIVEPR